MRQLRRHCANANVASTCPESAEVRSSDRSLRPNPAGCHDISTTDEGCQVRADTPSLAVIYDGASVVKNTITSVSDAGQTRVVYYCAVEE